MNKSMSFPKDIEDKLAAYREQRKADTGKKMFRETAITELLRIALTNFKPHAPVQEQLDDLKSRVSRLEDDNCTFGKYG